MTLRLTSAPVSGIQKRKSAKPPPKSRASPFSAHARRKPNASQASVKAVASDFGHDEPLPDQGTSHYISETAVAGNVEQAIRYVRTKMFDELPERAGMNSTRIAEVLNLRRSLPPLASVAHIHTLLNAPTQVERQIVELVKSGRVRRLVIPGRGNDAAGLGDCLVLAEDWDNLVRDSPALDVQIKDKFLDILNRIGTHSALSQGIFEPDEYRALMRAGFLVSSSTFTQGSLSLASLPNLPGAAVSSASRISPFGKLSSFHSVPSSFKEDPRLRVSKPASANVKLFRNWRKLSDEDVSERDNKPEFWVCRQSEHPSFEVPGTASWPEFLAGLRTNHAENEMEYTPSVTSVDRLLAWERTQTGEVEVNGLIYKDIDVEINLITHTFHPSAMISPRSFISLTISASYDCPLQPDELLRGLPSRGFITIQIPLCWDESSTPEDIRQKISFVSPKKTIFANYASVEQVNHLTPREDRTSRIEWTMATTSDAKGKIPKWVQRNWTLGGVPRAVVADVGLFIKWTEARRAPDR
ncbi:Serine-threonine protein kinase 19 [Penicillium verhagenii]|nr:Serine-threonine protein kinase 19 [Penicillium verhagenii]